MSAKTPVNTANERRSRSKTRTPQKPSDRGKTRSRKSSKNQAPKNVRFVREASKSLLPTGATVSMETIPNVGMSEMRKWVENHYDLSRCFLIPREQRAYVQPHKWNFSTDIINAFTADGTDKIAIKMRPSVKNFLSIGKATEGAIPIPYDEGQTDETEYPSFKSNAMGEGYSYDERIKCVGGVSIKAGLVDTPNTYRYQDAGKVKFGLKMYSGAIEGSWDGKINYLLYNPDNANAGCSVTISMIRQLPDGSLAAEDIGGGAFTIPANGSSSGTVGANASLYTDIKAFGFAFKIINSETIGQMPSGFSARFGFTNPPTIVQPLVWRDLDVWQVISDPSGALQRQYENSNFHCFTAMHATFTNTQAKLYEGGSVQAAQLSGLSDEKLPHTFEGLNTWLGNRTYDTNSCKDLKKGLHWNYRWEKIQDTFFISEDNEEHQGIERPSLLTTMIAPPNVSSGDKKFSFTLHGAVMLEYITEIRDAPVFLAPADTINLLARYCAIRAEMPCLMENPSHFETIKDNVKKIMNHPVVRTMAKEAAMAGLKLLVV